MEVRKETRVTQPQQRPEKKSRFQFVKLEERIAPSLVNVNGNKVTVKVHV